MHCVKLSLHDMPLLGGRRHTYAVARNILAHYRTQREHYVYFANANSSSEVSVEQLPCTPSSHVLPGSLPHDPSLYQAVCNCIKANSKSCKDRLTLSRVASYWSVVL